MCLVVHVSRICLRFNCTIMELKFDLGLMPISEQVLIVLSWNWNKEFKDIVTHYADVLIVSSWNWNIGVSQLANALNVVLIVLLWNWNVSCIIAKVGFPVSFNCTIVEFKYKRTKLKDNKAMQCFNCTIMELKLITHKGVL